MWGGGGEQVKKNRDPTPDYLAYVFVFICSIIIWRLYKLTRSDQAYLHSATESFFLI
jgi:hypothetical protein